MNRAPWSEEAESEAGAVVLRFDGLNADVAEELEVAKFAQGVKTPADEDKGGAQFVTSARYQRRVMTPVRALSLCLGFALTGASVGVMEALDVTSSGARTAVAFVAWFVGFTAIPITLFVLKRPTAPKVTRTPEEQFVLTFHGGTFVLKGSQGTAVSVPLADIRAFESQLKRLVIVHRDGAKTRLPCAFVGGTRPDALATRLTELALAAAQGSTYRGSQSMP